MPARGNVDVSAKLQFSTQPGGAVTGVALTQQPVVRALTASGKLNIGFTGDVTLAISTGSSTISGTVTVAAVAGVATFSNVVLTTAGHCVIQATSSGLTSILSGYITVNPAATAAKTALTFGALTTDKINCGSASSVDNLTNAGTITAIVRQKRNATGTNQYLVGKLITAGGVAGWLLGISDISSTGRLTLNVGRASVNGFVASNSSNTIATGTWYDVGFTYDSGSTPKLFIAATGVALAEVSGYDASSVNGTGTATADAAADLYIGNTFHSGINPAKSDIEWVAVFSTVLTAQQMLQVQMGFDANDSARILAIGNCKLLMQCNATGTLTDLSGNGNSGVVTGATTSTGQTIFAPTVWGASYDAINTSDLYKLTSTKGFVQFSTAATSVNLGMYRGSAMDSTYDSQAAIAVFEDGAYKGQALATPSTGGYSYGTVALTAGTKTVTLVNSPHLRSGSAGTGGDGLGSTLVSVGFNAAATEVVPATPSVTWLIVHDSVLDGFLTSSFGTNAPNSVMRTYMAAKVGAPSWISLGFGGQSLKKLATDSTAQNATAATIATYSPQVILINLGANDYISNLWTAANFQTAAAALLVAINAACPLAQIYVVTPFTLASDDVANGGGDALAAYRTAWVNAASGKNYVQVLTGPAVWNGTNSVDGIHPNNTGAAALVTNLKMHLGTAGIP